MIILGKSSANLLDCLTRIMNKNVPEKLLACICLVNISFIEEAVKPILYHAPIQEWCPELTLLSNPESMVRTLENMLTLKTDTTPAYLSLEKESLRWACSLVKNLCTCEENANLLSLSDIPLLVIELLEKSVLPPSAWTVESIEDSALLALCRFAHWPILQIILLEACVPDLIRRFTGGEDVYDYKSHELLFSLGENIDNKWMNQYEDE